MIDVYFLILAMIAQIFNFAAELAVPTGIQTNEANVEIGTRTLTAEVKIRKCSK